MNKRCFRYCFCIIAIALNLLNAQDRTNLGPVINDNKRTEAYIAFAPDGNTMYFSRRNPNTHFDIYMSTKGTGNQWSQPQPIHELNNEKPNMVFYVFPDGNSMLINGAYPEKGICKVTKVNGKWSQIEYLQFEKKITQWDQHNAKLSKDGKVMILSFQYDICVSFLQPNGKWSYPKKLPSTINTPYYEYTPFLAPDDKALFFSSGGHGAQQNDIFVTYRLDDTWLNWATPINCGNSINSESWESYFSIPNNSELCYVYSLQEGNGDLFHLPIKNLNLGEPKTSVSGIVFDKTTKKPLPNTQIEFIYQEQYFQTSTDDNGNYTVWLPFGKEYLANLTKEGYKTTNEKLNLSAIQSFQNLSKNFFLEKGQDKSIPNAETDTQKELIGIVYFDFDKDFPQQTSVDELNYIINNLKKDQIHEVIIEGHTDSVGTDIYNMKLSMRRAKSVWHFFRKAAIPDRKVHVYGFGEDKPIESNSSEEGRARNRRVEIYFKKK